jgi:hypothetical protein
MRAQKNKHDKYVYVKKRLPHTHARQKIISKKLKKKKKTEQIVHCLCQCAAKEKPKGKGKKEKKTNNNVLSIKKIDNTTSSSCKK